MRRNPGPTSGGSFPVEPSARTRRNQTPTPRVGARIDEGLQLESAIGNARQAAWKGAPIDPLFVGALEFAAAGGNSLVFLHGEYVGEVALDQAERDRSLRRGFLRVYHEFNPNHRFYHISDPRRLSPGFAHNRGCFPSRDTAAVALLETLAAEGNLRRFENTLRSECNGMRSLVTFTTVSLAAPWFRVSFREQEFGWVMVDRQRSAQDGRWFFLGPSALGTSSPVRFFHSREAATRAMLEAIARSFAEDPERFGEEGASHADHRSWNAVAADLAWTLTSGREEAQRAVRPEAGSAELPQSLPRADP